MLSVNVEAWHTAIRLGWEYRGSTPGGAVVRWIQTPMDRARAKAAMPPVPITKDHP